MTVPTENGFLPELLAPAGGEDALRAAVNNGADAVYLGVGDLNARRGAENFSMESLQEACRFAHLRGVRVYLAANVLVRGDEMEAALRTVDAAWAAGVDAVILQDLGLLKLVRETLPHVRIHASTQIGAHNSGTIAELERLGVSRVTLARETSLTEIAGLVASSSAELESFVHGALCVSYSGQCLMSSMIGGRSGNRGLCAQPCRLPYRVIAEGREASTKGPHLLSPRDLLGLEVLPQLLATGVSALKIEGRMKSPEYVALVTSVYRNALDRAVEDPDAFEVREGELEVLEEAFSRGFTSAYLTGLRDARMMSFTRPNNRGVLVGRVAHVEGQRARIHLDRAIDPADTLEVWTSSGRITQKAGPLTVEGKQLTTAPAGADVSIDISGKVARGDRVFRVANAALETAARRTFSRQREQGPIQLDVHVRLLEGQPLLVRLSAKEAFAEAHGPVVETARTKAVTVEEVTEHVGRFGGTPFTAGTWDIELQAGVGIGYSALHTARREAAEDLERRLLEPWLSRERLEPAVPSRRARKTEEAPVPDLVAWCATRELAERCLRSGADRAVVPHWALEGPGEEELVLELPRVVHDAEAGRMLRLAEDRQRVVVGNLGMLRALATPDRRVEAHWGLNSMNPWTADVMAALGAEICWLSPELSGRQVAQLTETSPVPAGMAVYGRQEVMVTEHCVLTAEGPCEGRCPGCERRIGWRYLRDAKGYEFPVTTDPEGRSHVFNSIPLDLSRSLAEVLAAGVAALRLDFTTETLHEAGRIVAAMKSRLKEAIAGREAPDDPLVAEATTGHFFRGVK